jgi:hypothetical protein
VSRRLDLALAGLCLLLAAEAVFLAPLNPDAAFTLRQARAQAEGAVPCRDLACEYTPLATTVMAFARGAILPSFVIIQAVLFGCALLTRRLARALGHDPGLASRMGLVTWALLLSNDGRSIEVEPFSVACLLGAATAAAGDDRLHSFRAGVWVAGAFWAKQFGLLGWVGLALFFAGERRWKQLAGLTGGVILGVAAGFGVLLALGTPAPAFAGLFRTGAYPGYPIWSNLAGAPELLGVSLLTLASVAAAPREPDHDKERSRRLTVSMAAAALLPFAVRGYRHYWHYAIPFLVLLLHQPQGSPSVSWVRPARRAAMALLAVSVGLDAGRCARDLATHARLEQRTAARRLAALSSGASRPLYLIDPALLPLLDAPVPAPREVGPKFTRLTRAESEALLAAADLLVWDTSWADADQPLRRLAADPVAELARRGFVLKGRDGPIRVYSRPPG